MTADEALVDAKRRLKEHYRSVKRQQKPAPGQISAVFSFTPNEIGLASPTQEEIKMMEKTNPKVAKSMRYYNPLEHLISMPVTITRNQEIPLKEQWRQARAEIKAELIKHYQEARLGAQQSKQPMLDLSQLTTAGDDNVDTNS